MVVSLGLSETFALFLDLSVPMGSLAAKRFWRAGQSSALFPWGIAWNI
jgi:hypothetical protein